MTLGDRFRHHRVAVGAVLMLILACFGVGGLYVAEARLERLTIGRGTASTTTTTTTPTTTVPAEAPDAPDTPDATDTTDATDPLVDAILGEVNTARTNAATTALDPDPRLARNARRWAATMADAGVLSHQDLAPVLGLGYTSAGELVVSGPPEVDAAEIRRSWTASPTDRAALSSSSFAHAGVGVVRDDGGRVWVAVVLAG